MNITKSIKANAVDLLGKDEDSILIELGKQVSLWEADRTGVTLSRTKDDTHLKKKAAEYLVSKKSILQKAVCTNWRAKNLDIYTDIADLIVALALIIAEALDLSQSYANLVVVISVIILKRGINKFCEDCP